MYRNNINVVLRTSVAAVARQNHRAHERLLNRRVVAVVAAVKNNNKKTTTARNRIITDGARAGDAPLAVN